MEAKIQSTGKKALKIVGAACFATGVVAVSAMVAGKISKQTMKGVKQDMAKSTLVKANEKIAENVDGGQ